MSSIPLRARSAARSTQLKQAVAEVFAGYGPEGANGLAGFREKDWRGIERWLDISGMALYLLDQLRRDCMESVLPPSVLMELEGRLERNRERTRAMFKEAREICEGFDTAGLPYVLLKGVTLTPDSVPDAALRWQTDLDFMVPRRCARAAREYVEDLGYSLHADTGSTLEFRIGAPEMADIRKIYSIRSERTLELHIDDGHTDVLACRRVRRFHGARISALRPADILVRQALHLLKHLCGEHTRLSWVLEFRRHAESQRDNLAFWEEVTDAAAQEPNGNFAMGIAFWLVENVFGTTDVTIPEIWREQALPVQVHLWLSRYAEAVLFADGATKHFALLQKEVPGRAPEARSTLHLLLPPRFPSRFTRSAPQQGDIGYVKRLAIDAQHFLSRLRFHAVEGARFVIEVTRWRRAVARCGRS
jgi:hypothetical protein